MFNQYLDLCSVLTEHDVVSVTNLFSKFEVKYSTERSGSISHYGCTVLGDYINLIKEKYPKQLNIL